MRDLIINTKNVYSSGNKYIDISLELEKIKSNLTNLSENIIKDNKWSNDNSHDFIESFTVHISELSGLIEFLKYNGEILKGVSSSHDRVDEEFVKSIERSDIDEQRYS